MRLIRDEVMKARTDRCRGTTSLGLMAPAAAQSCTIVASAGPGVNRLHNATPTLTLHIE